MAQFMQKKTFNLIFGLIMLSFVIGMSAFYYQYQRYINANRWVIHTYTVLSQLDLLELQLYKRELNKSSALSAKQSNQDDGLIAVLQQINNLTKDNAAQQIRLQALSNFIEKNLNAKPVKKSTVLQGPEWFSTINNMINDIRQAELALLAARNAGSEHDIRLSLAIGQFLVLFSITLLIFNILLINQQFRLLNLSEQKNRDYLNLLEESEAFKTEILDSASDSIITVNQSGDILSANKPALIFFGYSYQAIMQLNIQVLVPELLNHLQLGHDEARFECMVNNADQQLIPMEIVISKRYTSQDGYVIVMRDISERRKNEMLKNEFVSIVSHELRTPLTAIHGAIVLLQHDKIADKPDESKKLLNIAESNSKRLIALINDLLDVQKMESGMMVYDDEAVNVNQLIESCLQPLQYLIASKKITVNLHANEIITMRIDAKRLTQAVTNLLANAIKFANPNSTITMHLNYLNDQTIRFSIHNFGKTIPASFRERAFQKFAQANSSSIRTHGGTGLGLSITKAIIEHYHGSIDYQSDDQQGTTFFFDLPKN